MKSMSPFLALPPYFGGKRRLLPWIFGTLARVVPQSEWSQYRFFDTFAGGGASVCMPNGTAFHVSSATIGRAAAKL